MKLLSEEKIIPFLKEALCQTKVAEEKNEGFS